MYNKLILTMSILNFIAILSVMSIMLYGKMSKNHIPVFEEPVNLTQMDNNEFVDFLNTHAGEIVYINSDFDASVSTSSQQEIIDTCGFDDETIETGGWVPIPVDNGEGGVGCENSVVFELNADTSFNTSSGGTGLYFIHVKNFFEIQRTHESGPRIVYYLKQIQVPFEIKRNYLKD